MATVITDCKWGAERRRHAAYSGTVFLFSPRPASLALVEVARQLLEDSFAPYHPTEAQHHLPVEDYAAALAKVKPAFIHHPECKRLIPRLLDDLGCDLDEVFFDVPKLRSSTANGYLTTGIAYAFPPHRDMWYAAPPQQLNWWLPVYEIEPDNGMAFHPQYFAAPVPNNSAEFNYYRCNLERSSVATMIGTDTRVRPQPTVKIELGNELRIVPPVGGVLLFSPQHLHASLPNTTDATRFSIDFRTVNRSDLAARRGAPQVDNDATGTALRDFVRCSDLAPLPNDLVAAYDDDTAAAYADALVYKPN